MNKLLVVLGVASVFFACEQTTINATNQDSRLLTGNWIEVENKRKTNDTGSFVEYQPTIDTTFLQILENADSAYFYSYSEFDTYYTIVPSHFEITTDSVFFIPYSKWGYSLSNDTLIMTTPSDSSGSTYYQYRCKYVKLNTVLPRPNWPDSIVVVTP